MNTTTKTELFKKESLVSCYGCRNKKKRCGRELPRCKECIKRGLECRYSNISRKRSSGPPVFSTFQNKVRLKNPNIQMINISNKFFNIDVENRYNTQNDKIAILQPISPLNSAFEGDLSKSHLSPIPSNQSQQFETHLTLILTQIVQYNQNIMPEIKWFLNKMHLAIYGGLTKVISQLNQEWIQELFEPNFKSKLINRYFTHFHPAITYLSKHYFYANIDKIHPALISVIMYVGYTNCHKQYTELRKYLKHCALIQLKKNMFNVNLGVCQALYIFGYSMLLHGLGKQSMPYFNQACLMSSALGIHVDMPNISREEQHQRHCIRGCALSNDTHLATTLMTQPYFLFLAPSARILDPVYQMNPFSTNPHERLRAECICTMRYCYDRYWKPTIHHTIFYFMTISKQTNFYQSRDFEVKIRFLNELYNYCMIQTLVKYLELSKRYQMEEELKIIKTGIWVFCVIYYHFDLVVYSLFPPTVDPKTGCLNPRTMKAVQAATGIYNITASHPGSFIFMYNHYLSGISLFYIKLIISLNSHFHIQSKLIEKFQQVYKLFKLSTQQYQLSNDILNVIESMANYFKIQLK